MQHGYTDHASNLHHPDLDVVLYAILRQKCRVLEHVRALSKHHDHVEYSAMAMQDIAEISIWSRLGDAVICSACNDDGVARSISQVTVDERSGFAVVGCA